MSLCMQEVPEASKLHSEVHLSATMANGKVRINPRP